jgi:hypothetical protein
MNVRALGLRCIKGMNVRILGLGHVQYMLGLRGSGRKATAYGLRHELGVRV